MTELKIEAVRAGWSVLAVLQTKNKESKKKKKEEKKHKAIIHSLFRSHFF